MRAVVCAVLAATSWCATGAAQENPKASAVSPAFSPDGANVAFAFPTNTNTDIAVMPSAGGKARVLSSFTGRVEAVQWFPDGKNLLVTGGGIWRVTLDGAKTPLAAGESARLSPDGKTLAVLSSGRLQMYSSPHAPRDAAVKNPHAEREDYYPCRIGDWLDNDTLMVLTGDGSIATILRTAPATHRILVPHKSMAHCFVAAATDTKRRLIAATSDDMQLADINNPASIWIFDSAGKQVGKPIPNATKPQWTTVGQLFFARRSQVMTTVDFEAVRTICKAETWAISPDGSLLIAGRRDADTNGDDLVNWRDALRFYRIPIQAGTARSPQLIEIPPR